MIGLVAIVIFSGPPACGMILSRSPGNLVHPSAQGSATPIVAVLASDKVASHIWGEVVRLIRPSGGMRYAVDQPARGSNRRTLAPPYQPPTHRSVT